MVATYNIEHRAGRFLAFAAFALVSALGVFADGAFAAGAPASAPATSPHGIIINHKFKADLGVSCEICHSPSETKPQLMSFPTMDTCSACHSAETDMTQGTDKCGICHTNADYSSTVPKDKVLWPSIVFDHRAHASAKVDCLSCHKIFDKVGVTGDEMLPTMNTCVTCHQAKKVPAGTDCATCHVDGNIGSEKPASHTALWIQSHGKGLSQKTIQNSCNLCHTVESGNDCNSCHQREAPPSHNATWTLSAHGQAARVQPQSCNVCHTQQQCLDCHTEEKPWTHTGNWGSTGGIGEDMHCVTCHVASGTYAVPSSVSSDCLTCHSISGIQVQHAEAPHRPASHNFVTTNCSTCHSRLSPPPQTLLHPAADDAQCVACHPHD